MTTDLTTDLTTTIDNHLAGYAEPDPVRRRELITGAWAPNGALIDPPLEGEGHDGICDLVDAVLSHFPGHSFARTSAVDAHHNFARYAWALVDGEGTEAMTGTDVVEIDEDGKLVRVVGFFGPLAALDS